MPKNNDDEFLIDDILLDVKKSKSVNVGVKGKSGERELAKIFSNRFPNHPPFSRVLGSGARWSQVSMSKQTEEVFTSDLVCPPNFNFCIECKNGYEEIDLFSSIIKGNKLLDGFLKQAKDSAARIDKKALMCWKKTRRGWLVFIEEKNKPNLYSNKIYYKDWVGINLYEFINESDNYFFKQC